MKSPLVLASLVFFATLSFGNGKQLAKNSYPNTLLSFEANHGQASPEYKFLSRRPGYSIFLSEREAVLRLHPQGKTEILRMELEHSRIPNAIVGEQPLVGKVNYLFEDNAAASITNVPTFSRVRYDQIYPGVDLTYYGMQGQLEYDFIVAPHASPASIRLLLSGAQSLDISQNGDLVATIAHNQIRWQKPTAYQIIAGKKQAIAARYQIAGNHVRFHLGVYDHSKQLVIDPVLVYSTYLGGSKGPSGPENPAGTDVITSMAVDNEGNAYVSGTTNSTDFPTTRGSLQPNSPLPVPCRPVEFTCSTAIFVTKLDPTGSKLIYSTYYFHVLTFSVSGAAIGVDSRHRAYLGVNNQLTILNPAGSAVDFQFLLPSDASIGALSVGPGGDAFVAGSTGNDLPVTAGAFQHNFGGGQTDGFVARIDPAVKGEAALKYASFIGGSDLDFVTSIASIGDDVYLAGSTLSTDFPTTPGVIEPSTGFIGGAFVAKVNTEHFGRSSLVYATNYGEAIALNGIAADHEGNAYLTGDAFQFQATPGAFHSTPAQCGDVEEGFIPCDDAFITKLNPTGTKIVWAAALNGTEADQASQVAVDDQDNVYVVGSTDSTDFPVTRDALQPTLPKDPTCPTPACGKIVAFVAKLNPAGSKLLYGTFLGNSASVAFALALDRARNIYVAGFTSSPDFVVNSGAFQRSLRGHEDGFVAKFSNTKLCALNKTSPSVTICIPSANERIESPVHIVAGTTDSHTIQFAKVLVDGVQKYELLHAGRFETFLPLSAGVHRLTVEAKDSTGATFERTIFITVEKHRNREGENDHDGDDQGDNDRR
jgi:hypothetical protein